jgi:hypothetical protein
MRHKFSASFPTFSRKKALPGFDEEKCLMPSPHYVLLLNNRLVPLGLFFKFSFQSGNEPWHQH